MTVTILPVAPGAWYAGATFSQNKHARSACVSIRRFVRTAFVADSLARHCLGSIQFAPNGSTVRVAGTAALVRTPERSLPRIPHIYIHSRQRKVSPNSLPVPKSPAADRPPVLHSHLWLGSVENLEELSDSVSHPRVHVRLGALDVIVQVITEQLDAVDGRDCLGRVGEVSGEQDCKSAHWCEAKRARWR